MRVCLFGDGNLMQSLGIKDTMDVYIGLGANIAILSQLDDPTDSTIASVLDDINLMQAFKKENNDVTNSQNVLVAI